MKRWYHMFMWHAWQQFLRQPIVWISLSVSSLALVASWVVLLWQVTPQTDLIVLHYTMALGVDRLGTWYEALLIPVVGLFLLITNTFIAYYFINRNKLISSFFLILTSVFELFILSAAVFVIIANLPGAI